MQSIPQILMSFQADLTSRTDYYPFGMEIQSRSGNYTNIDYSADVNKLLYSGLLSKCNNYEAIIQNPQPGLNVLINCQTAQNVYGQDYVDALQIEDHTGGLNFDLNMNINLSEIIPSLESDGDYVIELSMLGTHEREITAHIGNILGVISSPSHSDGGNLIPADDKVVTFSLKGSDLQALATNNQILLNLTFIFHGGTSIIKLQNLKVFQIFEGYSVPLAKRLEKGYGFGFNTQEKVDEIAGAGNHYTAPFWEYDPRVVMRWNTDPVTRAYKSPYVINSNNPITNNDPDGDCDDCETQVSGQVSATYTFGTKGQSNFNLSTGIGGSVRSGNVQGGLNLSLNLYNGGLGTTQGSTGQSGFQSDFVVSPSLTFGSGQASPMATNTFNSMSLSGVTNSFKSSGTLASNFIFNSDGRNQRVGSVGGRFGDFSFNVYNDFFPGIGDRGDEYWTGGGAGNINVGSGNIFSFGTEVFTGLRIGNKKDGFKLDPTNPANGRYGTYQQTDAQKNMNNGQTFFRLTTSDGLRLGVNFSGGANSGYSQAGIHNYLPGIKSSVFDYSHSIPSIQAIGGVLQGD